MRLFHPGATLTALLLAAALLAGCGQKGPLYLPEVKTPPADAPAPKEKTALTPAPLPPGEGNL